MLVFWLIAQAAAPAGSGVDPAGVVAALGGLAVGVAAIITAIGALRRRRNADEDDVEADPVSAVRAHITALENALRTCQSGERDAVTQRDDARHDRDRYKAEADMKTAQHSLALTQIGDLERRYAEARRRIEELIDERHS